MQETATPNTAGSKLPISSYILSLKIRRSNSFRNVEIPRYKRVRTVAESMVMNICRVSLADRFFHIAPTTTGKMIAGAQT